MDEPTIWKLIDIYFKENPQTLVRHHIDSYNQFIEEDIFQIFRDMNPLKVRLSMDESLQDFRTKCDLYIGGKDGTRVYFGKPIIYDPKNSHYMYPNEARLREMTYGITIHYDIDVEYTRILGPDDIPTEVDENGYMIFSSMGKDENRENPEDSRPVREKLTPSEMAKLRENAGKTIDRNRQLVKVRLEKVYLGKFPIMVQSNVCILNNMPRLMRFALGECKNDLGGYFIIDGKEKAVVPQEAFGDNMINVSKSNNEKYAYTLEMKSISENISKPKRTLSLRVMNDTASAVKQNIGVFIPNTGEVPIPLFVVFRALGILSDRDIISFCTLQQPEYTPVSFLPYIDACIHDASAILTQEEALEYITRTVKGRSHWRAHQVIADFLLPHIGELEYLEKAYYLGYLANRLLSVTVGIEPPTDRDSYKYKRVSLIGPLLKNLFSDYYQMQLKYINLQIETIHVYNERAYHDIGVLLHEKYDDIFQKRMVEEGLRKAFKGNWGAYSHTKIVGVLQDLNRLSHNSMMNHLRKTNLPMDSSLKIVAPRVLHGSQWGIIDPIDTPDGGNVGLHKHLSLMTHITTSLSREPLIEWLKKNTPLVSLKQSNPIRMGKFTKVFVNGHWIGGIADPHTFVNTVKLHRRHGLIPITMSIMFDYSRNSILLSTDGGRLCRPIFYRDEVEHHFAFNESNVWKTVQSGIDGYLTSKNSAINTGQTNPNRIWFQLVSGFHEKKLANYNPYKNGFYEWKQLYGELNKSNMKTKKAVFEYMDSQETEGSLIAMHYMDATANSKRNFTHCELHPSTTYGMMCNLINYVEHNPASRNSFSCGQSKQACSLYSTNYQNRMDKSALILNQGQIPLVKSRYLQYINNEENPYGENAIVAISCYTGYNVEDAILINEGALQRGLFRTTYFNTYTSKEEKEVKHQMVIREKIFSKVQFDENVEARRIDPDFDYSYLDDNGIVRENTEVHDKMVLIGQTESIDAKGNVRDASMMPKKGQMGFVDKTFITEGEEGERIAKVRIRHERIPAMGDKFASRAGQKGTIGMIIPEADMPYTKDGIRPDMIINPHALPSRMTIGQMIEAIVGKACAMKGAFGDCTAFSDNKNKLAEFGDLLTHHNFHSTGDEVLYNGMNGKQMESTVFIGPTYYMRLKHMVKDKINYRARGPRTNMTRQPVSGRANDGGLRIGEMERDAVISHGMSHFLQESMMERADKYQMAICNHTGMVAIYNPGRDIMLSPAADGPIQYGGSLHHNGEIEVQQMSKYGRSFSIVKVPYAMKLLLQELQAIQVQMRIITEDNIHQISNMKNSHTMELLTKDPNANIQVTLKTVQERLKNKKPIDEKEFMAEWKQSLDEKTDDGKTDETQGDDQADVVDNTEITEVTDEINADAQTIPTQKVIPRTPEESPPAPSVELRENEILRESRNYPGHYYIMNEKTGQRTWIDNEGKRIGEDTQAADATAMRGGGYGVGMSATGTPLLLEKGMAVFWRNDVKKPERVWKIMTVGPNYYNITTTDTEKMDSISESIQVVDPADVYVYTDEMGQIDTLESPKTMPPVEEVMEMPYLQSQDLSTVNPNPNGTIQIAPVIKVFNHGNDMSQTTGSTVGNEQDTIQEFTDTPSEMNNTNRASNDSSVQSGPVNPPVIDFNNLVIKKAP